MILPKSVDNWLNQLHNKKKLAFPNFQYLKKMGWPEVCWPNQPIFLKY